MRTLRHKMTIIGLVLFMGLVGMVREAAAQPSPNVYDGGNMWLITYYDDCDKVHSQWASQTVCFLPYKPCGACGIRGLWYSPSFTLGWRGGYMQEGDRLLMHGNWDWPGKKFVGSDGMVFDLFSGTSPMDEAAGQWTEWFNTPPYGMPDFYGNARLKRIGKCHLPPNVDFSRMTEAELEKLTAELSSKVKARVRKDGKPPESPNDPMQVPLPEEKEYQRQ